MTFKVIAFCGPAGSGKDTCHLALAELGLVNEQKIALAGNLKKLCGRFFHIHPSVFEDRILKEKEFDYSEPLTEENIRNLAMAAYEMLPYDVSKMGDLTKHVGVKFRSPRHMLQYVGTEIIRNTLDITWHLRGAFADETKTGIYAITDLRFASEAEFVKNLLGDRVRICFINNTNVKIDMSHPSESEVLKIKDMEGVTVVDNSSTIEDLKVALARTFLSDKGEVLW